MKARRAHAWAIAGAGVVFLLAVSLRVSFAQVRLAQPSSTTGWRGAVHPPNALSNVLWLHDEWLYYVSTAVNAFKGRGFFADYSRVRDGEYVAPPLQSVFLLGQYVLARRIVSAHFSLIVQALLGGMAALLACAVARSVGSVTAGFVAGLLVAGYPDLVFWSAYLLTESNYIFGLALVLWLLVRWADRPSAGRAALAAIALGFLHLQRPNALLAGPLLGLAALGLRGFRRGARDAALFALLPVVVLVPWLLRNIHHYGEPVLVSSNAGVLFYMGNHSLLDPKATPYWEDLVQREPTWADPEIEARTRTPAGRLRVTYYAYSNDYLAAARQYIVQRPAHFLHNALVKFGQQFIAMAETVRAAPPWFPARYYRALNGVVVIGGALGLVLAAWLRRGPALTMMLVMFACYAFMGALFLPSRDGRLDLPLRFMFLLFAAIGWDAFVRRILGRPVSDPAPPESIGRAEAGPGLLETPQLE